MQNTEEIYCFLWCILDHFYKVGTHSGRASMYKKHFTELNIGNLQIPMKMKDTPKIEN